MDRILRLTLAYELGLFAFLFFSILFISIGITLTGASWTFFLLLPPMAIALFLAFRLPVDFGTRKLLGTLLAIATSLATFGILLYILTLMAYVGGSNWGAGPANNPLSPFLVPFLLLVPPALLATITLMSIIYSRSLWIWTASMSRLGLMILLIIQTALGLVCLQSSGYSLLWHTWHDYQQTRLLQAVEQADLQVVNQVLNSGIDPNFIDAKYDPSFRTPLCLAFHQQQPEIVEALLAHGAQPEFCNLSMVIQDSPEYVSVILERYQEIGYAVNYMDVMAAIDQPEMLRQLLAEGGEPDPGHLTRAINLRQYESIQILLEAGLKPRQAHLDMVRTTGNRTIIQLIQSRLPNQSE